MRIFLHILLGAIAFIALFHGIRKVWQAKRQPDDAVHEGEARAANDNEGEFTQWLKSRNGRISIILLSMLLLYMALERVILVGGDVPEDYVPVPPQSVQQSGR